MATTIITKYGSGAPTASDVVRGELAVDTENKRLYTEDSGGSVVELGTNPAANVTFGDNVKAVFGAGSDLQIYHDGSHSIIQDAGTGDLILQGGNDLILRETDGSTEYLRANEGAGVQIFHNGSQKFLTTSTGVDVTGTVTADGLTVDGSTVLQSASGVGNTVHMRGGDYTSTSFATGIKFEQPSGTLNANRQFRFTSGSSSLTIQGTDGSGTDVSDAKLVINPNGGNVGIGTDSPSSYNGAGDNLVIAETSGGAGITIASSTTGSGHILFADGTSGTGAYDGFIRFDHTTSSMRFASGAGVERMRIDSSGNLLVGTSSADGDGLSIKPRASGSGTTTQLLFDRADTATEGFAVVFHNNSTLVGSITYTNSATSFNTSSDQRLKENIVDAPSASDDIDAIQVRSFDWKADGSHQKYGMVAQELVTVAPEAVSQPEDPEEMMGVDYSKLVPMMLKEIQQLRARVAQLEGAN